MVEHHELDPYPFPEDKGALYVNEPWVIDETFLAMEQYSKGPEDEPDNVRVYVPLDLNRRAILRRLDRVISRYKYADEENELRYSSDVDMIRYQLEVYDQIWCAKGRPQEGRHSAEGIELARVIIERLEDIEDGGAEVFPFDVIDEMREDYLGLGPVER